MGEILGFRKDGKTKNVYQVKLDPNEVYQLKGEITKMHLFSENMCGMKSHVSQRGAKEATTYFLVPKKYRNVILKGYTKCIPLESKDKMFFVYVVDKKKVSTRKK